MHHQAENHQDVHLPDHRHQTHHRSAHRSIHVWKHSDLKHIRHQQLATLAKVVIKHIRHKMFLHHQRFDAAVKCVGNLRTVQEHHHPIR